MNLNTVTLTGNLTKAPELKATQSGVEVCKMRLAVNDRVKKNDEWVDRANYFDVTAFGKTAENVAKYLDKGSAVAIAGKLRWREWTQDDGSKRQAVEIVADVVQFIGAKAGGDAFEKAKNFVGDEDGDSIPF